MTTMTSVVVELQMNEYIQQLNGKDCVEPKAAKNEGEKIVQMVVFGDVCRVDVCWVQMQL